MGRAFGIEEEFFLLDSKTFMPRSIPADVSEELLGTRIAGSTTQYELLACQIESATAICASGIEALESLDAYRTALKQRCMNHGITPIASGTLPLFPAEVSFAPGERYHQISQFAPALAREHFICGLHVHVQIPDLSVGLRAMNALRSWLPILSAIGANSPFWNGEDTGFASWRTIHYQRWAVTGIPPSFDSIEGYEQYMKRISASDVVLDNGHIFWSVRLSERYPTVEVRVADTQLSPRESVMIALLVREIVDTVVESPRQGAQLSTGLLELSLWQAAKHGLDGSFFDPRHGMNIDSGTAMQQLLDYVADALKKNGDETYVLEQLNLMHSQGNGARRQRSSWDRGGLQQLVLEGAANFCL